MVAARSGAKVLLMDGHDLWAHLYPVSQSDDLGAIGFKPGRTPEEPDNLRDLFYCNGPEISGLIFLSMVSNEAN